jgi:hypothetical protein
MGDVVGLDPATVDDADDPAELEAARREARNRASG